MLKLFFKFFEDMYKCIELMYIVELVIVVLFSEIVNVDNEVMDSERSEYEK